MNYCLLMENLQNNTVFEVDNNLLYNSKTTDPLFQHQIYDLYLSNSVDNAVNASIINICMDGVVIIEGEIECGDIINGTLQTTDVANYYYFNLEYSYDVIFDSCFSSFDTWLELYDLRGHSLYHANSSTSCYSQAELSIDSLSKGKYVLAITGEYASEFGQWEVDVICDTYTDNSCNDTDILDMQPYILIPYEYSWFDGQ
eukprot:236943_1